MKKMTTIITRFINGDSTLYVKTDGNRPYTIRNIYNISNIILKINQL